jgi:hypothetical protein
MYTQHTLCLQSIYTIIKEVSEKTCFLPLYNNEAAAVVDYIIFNFDNFLSVILYGQVFLKTTAMYGVKSQAFVLELTKEINIFVYY